MDLIQHAGTTVDHVTDDPHAGWVAHHRTRPDRNGYARLTFDRLFGPNLDVYGWFAVADWGDRAPSTGVKLHTALEDNHANNTISLAKTDGTVAWYVEDRHGWNSDTLKAGHSHSPPQDRPWMDGLNHVGVRHRFWWRQRLTAEGMAGRLVVDGRVLIDTVDDDCPLHVGRVGWRLDGLTVDWALTVREP